MGRSSNSKNDAPAGNQGISQIEGDYKEDLQKCIAILRRHVIARNPVLRYMVRAGWTETSEPAVITKSKATIGKEKSAATRKEKAAQNQAERQSTDRIPTKYSTLGMMSYSLLSERVLPSLDFISYSQANIAAQFKKGDGAEMKKEKCLEIIEYLTGKPASLPLKGENANWEGLYTTLREAAAVRGRMESPLRMPVDWAVCGLYRILRVTRDDEIHVRHQVTNSTVYIHMSEFKPVPSTLQGLVIEFNYSETFAQLSLPTERKVKPVLLHGFFPVQTMKKRAICDVAEPQTPNKGGSSSSSSSKKRKGSPKSA
mmetsp:Transcript_63244/g.150848  ORF Transcript_63244/g.150848 Transcript_63244/m.150848 type:complete len:313 (-) Transcript_63244:255-1193(-)|eukprot:CAMPEP_0178439204 /NCGR_PEP_ID=MMETSP0689_2-20121128/36028_1 /TAXON_ID=160604 /ORGANISM="Amphidinium massartii, Strain CS-259" /LENGTH=312 /DNA_ID=CAMNT_0020061711 /DNA_START=79 /DNA_END=1017 /DNA_ORIENTATION=+